MRKELNGIIDLNRAAIVRKAGEAEGRAGHGGHLDQHRRYPLLPHRLHPVPQPAGAHRRTRSASSPRASTASRKGTTANALRSRVGASSGTWRERFNAMAGELERWENSNLARIMEEKARAEAVINSLQDASIGLDDQGPHPLREPPGPGTPRPGRSGHHRQAGGGSRAAQRPAQAYPERQGGCPVQGGPGWQGELLRQCVKHRSRGTSGALGTVFTSCATSRRSRSAIRRRPTSWRPSATN